MNDCGNCTYYPICELFNDSQGIVNDSQGIVNERQKGKWIKPSNKSTRSYQRVCNRCNNISYFCGKGNYPNCPYCLAEMEDEK